MSITTILFDFGGVLVRTRDQKLRRLWEERLGLAPGQAAEIVFGGESGQAVQLGKISDELHWRWVQRRLALDDATFARFRHDFFAADELDQGLLAYAGELRRHGYHVGLLSNASATARQGFAERFHILGNFDSVTISGEEGVMKPDERIFRIALARAGARPEETVFVDDFVENVAAAQALGLHGIHFADRETVIGQLTALTGVPPPAAA